MWGGLIDYKDLFDYPMDVVVMKTIISFFLCFYVQTLRFSVLSLHVLMLVKDVFMGVVLGMWRGDISESARILLIFLWIYCHFALYALQCFSLVLWMYLTSSMDVSHLFYGFISLSSFYSLWSLNEFLYMYKSLV